MELIVAMVGKTLDIEIWIPYSTTSIAKIDFLVIGNRQLAKSWPYYCMTILI